MHPFSKIIHPIVTLILKTIFGNTDLTFTFAENLKPRIINF